MLLLCGGVPCGKRLRLGCATGAGVGAREQPWEGIGPSRLLVLADKLEVQDSNILVVVHPLPALTKTKNRKPQTLVIVAGDLTGTQLSDVIKEVPRQPAENLVSLGLVHWRRCVRIPSLRVHTVRLDGTVLAAGSSRRPLRNPPQ